MDTVVVALSEFDTTPPPPPPHPYPPPPAAIPPRIYPKRPYSIDGSFPKLEVPFGGEKE